MAITIPYTVVMATDKIGKDSVSDGAVRKLKDDMETAYTHLDNIQKNYSSGTAPASPQTGIFWYDSTTKLPKFYNGSVWIPIGGKMTVKDWTNSADQGGSAVTVTQAGGAVTTRLDFTAAPSTLTGFLISIAVVGTTRGAITCSDFDVHIYENSDAGSEDLVAEFLQLDGTVVPYGLTDNTTQYAFRNSDSTNTKSLWVKITNNLAADSSDFDIEGQIEYAYELS